MKAPAHASSKRTVSPAGPPAPDTPSTVFAAAFGMFLGLTLLKFGNPPIMEKFVEAPTTPWEFLLGSPWPIGWAYLLLGAICGLGLFVGQWRASAPRLVLLLPLAWLAWQVVAAGRSVDKQLSLPTVTHFFACIVCFYLGRFCLGRARRLTLFWIGLTVGFLLVLALGWQQRFGGLEQTRRYFMLYLYPKMAEVPPEYLKKLASQRIFASMFYPNALAGAVLLLLPVILAVISQARRAFTPAARGLLLVLVTGGALACLYWSGSKGGWLLMLCLGLITVLRLPLPKRIKILIVSLVLFAGLAGFIWKYSGFFERGATSVSARMDYWRAAVQTAVANPVFGTGPGTFSRSYEALKRPDAEMARLTHNDYLEQACDSGWVGFFLYGAFIVRLVLWTAPRSWGDWTRFAVWLGVLGFSLQGLLEFGLYLPALAWPAFAFMGLLLDPGNPIDKAEPPR